MEFRCSAEKGLVRFKERRFDCNTISALKSILKCIPRCTPTDNTLNMASISKCNSCSVKIFCLSLNCFDLVSLTIRRNN